jgi:CheY-like chemotaxis protein
LELGTGWNWHTGCCLDDPQEETNVANTIERHPRPEPVRAPLPAAGTPHSAASRARVLVAENDFEMRRMITRLLIRDGFDVVEARHGMEVLELLAAELLRPTGHPPVDLIISDFRMPGVTGLSVLSGLRDSAWSTPFIFITAFGTPELAESARLHGATAVLEKPFDPDDLGNLVAEIIPARTRSMDDDVPSIG